MVVRITHSKVSGRAQGSDPQRIYGNHWDEDHVVEGLDIGSDVQAHDATLDAISGKALDGTGDIVLSSTLAGYQPVDSDLAAIAALTTTAYGRSLLTLANAAALAAEVDSFFLTPAEGDAAYQPLDSDLTAIAALATATYGRSLLTLANATALAAEVDSFFLTPTEGNAAYQPLDSDLTAIAALTTTSYGRAFLALADAAAARTALGLGTAAVKNTGTSGNTVPLLDGNNTASGTWDLQQAGSFAVPLVLTSSNADAVQGPILKLLRSSASPAANDVLGAVLFQGRDSAGGFPIYGTMFVNVIDPSDTSADGEYVFQATVNNAPVNVARISDGMQVGSPTGGYKGAGSINASDVYNDNVALTCMGLAKEFIDSGRVDLSKWDAMVPDIIVPARQQHKPVVVETGKTEKNSRKEPDGSITLFNTGKPERVHLHEWTPIYDEEGNGVDAVFEPVYEVETIPEQRIKRKHVVAHKFRDMLNDGFDPRDPVKYLAKLKTDEALPGMPTQAEWAMRGHNGIPQSELFMRKWLAMEMLALVVMDHEGRIAALEKPRTKLS